MLRKLLLGSATALWLLLCVVLRQRRKQRRKELTNGDADASTNLTKGDADKDAKLANGDADADAKLTNGDADASAKLTNGDDLMETLASPDADPSAKLKAMHVLAAQIKDVNVTPPGLPVQEFLSRTQDGGLPVLDVRSPGEFNRGHIPGAHNIPLFTNEQRAEVGTIYAQQGREVAMGVAIQLVWPKLPELVQEVERLVQASGGPNKDIAVHCARGGMRSGSMAFMLRRHGFRVYVLAGGYKAYRGWATRCWDRALKLERRPDVDDGSGLAAEGVSQTGKDWKELENLMHVTQSAPSGEPTPAKQSSSIAVDDDAEWEHVVAGGDPDPQSKAEASDSLTPDLQARLSKTDKKKVSKARRKEAKCEARLNKHVEQGDANQPLVYRRPQIRLLTPPKTSPEEWATIDPTEAMSRLRICIVGGRPGVGKTKVLHALEALGHPIVDLEALALHRGNTFGWCGQGDALCTHQPSTEHFGNLVAMAWRKAAVRKDVSQSHLQYRWVFIEDEGLTVGRCEVPSPLFTMLQCAPLVVRVAVPKEARVKLLLEEYTSPQAQGNDPGKWLADMLLSVDRLGKKLGSQRLLALKEQLRNSDYDAVVRALLVHYDHLYDLHATDRASNGPDQRCRIVDVAQAPHIVDGIDASGLAQKVLDEVTAHEREATEHDTC